MNTDEFNVLHGLDANLPETKSDNILYHTTDTKRLFIGETELQNKYPKIIMTSETAKIEPDTYYEWGEVSSLKIDLMTPPSTDKNYEYIFQFTCGETPTTLNLPSGLKYVGFLTIVPLKTYIVSISNNICIINSVD